MKKEEIRMEGREEEEADEGGEIRENSEKIYDIYCTSVWMCRRV